VLLVKTFRALITETLDVEDLEELEAAADLFQFGIEKGYYNKSQSNEFNNTYWKVKNRCLAYEISDEVQCNKLDLISIVTGAPSEAKEDRQKLISYVLGRIKALKGNMKGMR
jgi:hypothetical protein